MVVIRSARCDGFEFEDVDAERDASEDGVVFAGLPEEDGAGVGHLSQRVGGAVEDGGLSGEPGVYGCGGRGE
jgi:hypothetical protein